MSYVYLRFSFGLNKLMKCSSLTVLEISFSSHILKKGKILNFPLPQFAKCSLHGVRSYLSSLRSWLDNQSHSLWDCLQICWWDFLFLSLLVYLCCSQVLCKSSCHRVVLVPGFCNNFCPWWLLLLLYRPLWWLLSCPSWYFLKQCVHLSIYSILLVFQQYLNLPRFGGMLYILLDVYLC